LRFLCKAIDQHGAPAKITIDKSGANAAAIESYKDDRAIKRQVRPMIGSKSFCRPP
jgi:putative transposase